MYLQVVFSQATKLRRRHQLPDKSIHKYPDILWISFDKTSANHDKMLPAASDGKYKPNDAQKRALSAKNSSHPAGSISSLGLTCHFCLRL